MIASALVAKVTRNKYIIFFQETCVIYVNKYNYNKIRLQKIQNFEFLCEKKIKIIKIYFCIFNELLECRKRMERIYNAIARIQLSSNLTLMRKINQLLSKQMSTSTHNNTQTLIP